jgi:hypothetical protein
MYDRTGDRVFISYSRSDFYFAEQLAVALRRHGVEVWLDVHELAIGSDWASAIDQAIAESDIFVLVASRAAWASPYVRGELDRAVALARPCVAVLPERRSHPDATALPTYDLTSSFGRGIDVLAADLRSGCFRGRQRRLPLPYSGGACVVAAAQALCLVFAIVLGLTFWLKVRGHEVGVVPHAQAVRVTALVMVAALCIYPAFNLRAFVRRRVSWFYLRSWLFAMPLLALVVFDYLNLLTGLLITPPFQALLGVSSDKLYLGAVPVILAGAVVLVSIVAVFATGHSAGVFRHLRTGAAPRRVRTRHIGRVAYPRDRGTAVRSYRLLVSDDDQNVGEEIRCSLRDAGISEAGQGQPGDRDIVVLTDRTPADWLSQESLRDPVAVVATSILLPVRGVMGRYQWVDYRTRRRKTLAALGRDLSAATSAAKTELPEVPERLQHVRLPWWVAVIEWMLFAMASLAVVVGVVDLERLMLNEHGANLWLSPLVCLLVAPVLVVLAVRVRRRQVTPYLLLGAMGLCWLAIIADGFTAALERIDPYSSHGFVKTYSIAWAVIIGLAWKSLRRWLPRHRGKPGIGASAVGAARGSWPWPHFVVSALWAISASVVFLMGLTGPQPANGELPSAAADVCADQGALNTFGAPLAAADAGIVNATGRTVVPAVERRIQVVAGVTSRVERYQPSGGWGAGMKTRIIAALNETVRANHNYLRRGFAGPDWTQSYHDLDQTGADLMAPSC